MITACADRRPVDPPPIVELRIFEGETTKTDITLSYNANFFLFATLEVARPIANGRTHPSPAIPVLTGCPVAGANYLDRPSPAAYFLFPDLSVRHEGWYRLSFNLYEATKEPEDLDIDRPAQTAGLEVLTPSPAPKTQSSMAWRLEVKSAPFQVYSAKKFPGLSESTEISRIVADQGCRVRIRRDIRMRKRNTDKSEYEAAYEEGMRSATRFTTPDSAFPPQTPTDPFRSASRGSMDASQLGVESYHRASMQESSYNSHGMHSAAPSMSHPSPFSAPPPPLNNAPSGPLPPLGPLAPPYPRAAPVQPPAASNHDFAVPLPPARFIERPPIEQAKPYYPQLPQPAAMPQLAQLAASPQPTAIPQSFPAEVSQPQPHSSMQLPAILTDNEPPRQPGTMYDPARRHWHLPDTGSSSKRSYSPRSDTTQHPLKHGMRPDHVPVASNHKASVIEADSDPYNDDDDDDQYVVQGIHPHGFMEYRRACGKSNRKPVPNLAQ